MIDNGKYRESFSYVDIAMEKVKVKAVRPHEEVLKQTGETQYYSYMRIRRMARNYITSKTKTWKYLKSKNISKKMAKD